MHAQNAQHKCGALTHLGQVVPVKGHITVAIPSGAAGETADAPRQRGSANA